MIDSNNVPQHIAIIMDGNGRWAKMRGLPRIMGHKEGIKTIKEIVGKCVELKVKALTLYTFSTENWKRPKVEVDALMGHLKEFLTKKIKELNKNNVRLNAIGQLLGLPKVVRQRLVSAMQHTAKNDGLIVTLALNYGSRDEIVHATKRIAAKVKRGLLNIDDIDEDLFSKELYTKNLPEVDLLIRTSGEFRLSNFLLWQLSYSELYITPLLWPDFKKKDLEDAIIDFQKRQRRFGSIGT